MMAHAAVNAGAISNSIAFTSIAHAGFAASDFVGFPAKTFWPLQYCNIVFDDLAANDISNGNNNTTIMGNAQTLWNKIHAVGAPVIQMMINMRTTSTDSCWFLGSDQTYITRFLSWWPGRFAQWVANNSACVWASRYIDLMSP